MQKSTLNNLLDTTPQLWRGHRPNHRQNTLPTGYGRMDNRLPGGGWPLGAVTELITGQPGLGELSLLLPVLAGFGEQGQWVVLIDPPWIPYPPSLNARGLSLEHLLLVRTRSEKESLWACEQALRNGRGGAVLAWPERIGFTRLRRLQLAAQESARLAFLYRPESARNESSPAALRLQLEHGGHKGTRVDVLKCRGSHPPAPTWIRFSDYANSSYQNAGHEPSAAHQPRPLLAGDTPATPRARSAYPRTGEQGDGGGGQRDDRTPRTDH
jgi:cell division inhibitor SulA